MVSTEPQLLEMLKLAAWQQAAIGVEAAGTVRRSLRIDDTPPPPIEPDRVLEGLLWRAPEQQRRSQAQVARDLVEKPSMNRRVHGVWAGTQLLLSAAANVSKLLWPPGRDSSDHCEDLRALLGVDGGWTLKNRELRDGFEHFGQKIVTWVADHPGMPFSDSKILHSSELASSDAQPIRTFVEDTFSVIFMGQSFELQPIEEELNSIRDAASPWAGTYLEA
ncbi:MAG: hypothetical protein KGZ72_08875 [Roseovarius sp.]|jgi:hypothetical protein|nr:hypothetical protein [Roseovarius sp.]